MLSIKSKKKHNTHFLEISVTLNLFLTLWGSIICSSIYAQVLNQNKIVSESIFRLSETDIFGSSVTSIGDIDGDGFTEIAVGAPWDDGAAPWNDEEGFTRGSVWVLFLNQDGRPKSHQKINHVEGGFAGKLNDGDNFGSSVASIGDLDGDGVSDLVVGAPWDDDGGANHGAIWVLFMTPDGNVKSHQKISDSEGSFGGKLDENDYFGLSMTSPGDLDGDGVSDLVVGAPWDDDGGNERGAIWVLFMTPNGNVKSYQKISDIQGGFTGGLENGSQFGFSLTSLQDIDGDKVSELVVTGPDEGIWVLFLASNGTVKSHKKISYGEIGSNGNSFAGNFFSSSVASLGDLDGDGISDLAIGAPFFDDGGFRSGAVWVLFLNSDGSLKSNVKISNTDGAEGDLIGLDSNDKFGSSVNSPGDLDGDGFPDLIVGADSDEGGGAVWVLFLNTDGSLKADLGINNTNWNASDTIDNFGSSVNSPGDLDSDGVTDLIVGAPLDDDGGSGHGAIWVQFLNADGTVRTFQKVSDTEGDFTGSLDRNDRFGSSVASSGDLDGDGIIDLVVGAPYDDDGGPDRGALWLLYMASDGNVKSHQKISDIEGGFEGNLNDGDRFGLSVASIGDLNNDGVSDFVAGVPNNDGEGIDRGAVWVLFFTAEGTVERFQKISDTEEFFTGSLDDSDQFGSSVTSLGDLDGDGTADLVVGAPYDDDGGRDRGAVWILFLTPEGSVKDFRKISDIEGDFNGDLDDGDNFGSSLASPGDLDGDGVFDLAVGAWSDDDGGSGRGAVWVLFLTPDGTVKGQEKISNTRGGFAGGLDDGDHFGSSVASPGDLDGDGVSDLFVGSRSDDEGGPGRGAVWVLLLNDRPRFGDDIRYNSLVRSNTNLPVTISLDDAHELNEAQLVSRRSGDDSRFTFINELILKEDGQYEGLILAGIVTDRSLQFFFSAEDIHGYSNRLPKAGVFEVLVDVPNILYPLSISQNTYQLISVPLSLTDPSPAALLVNDLGSYDATRWRFFEPRPGLSPEEYLEYPQIDSIVPGKSYWLISRDEVPIINTGAGLSISSLTPFSIPVEPGWNYIGNPFTFPVLADTSSIKLTSGNSFQVLTYEATGWQSLASNDSIEPFEGYIISNNSTEVDTLLIEAEEAIVIQDPAAVATPKAILSMGIRLSAKAGHTHDNSSMALLHQDALSDWDQVDQPEPPRPPGDYVSVYFPQPDWPTHFKKYNVDARSIRSTGEVWDLSVTTNVRDQVYLEFEELDTIPEEFEVWLVDEVLNHMQNLRVVPAYTVAVPLEHQPRQLKLVVGKSDFLRDLGIVKAELPREHSLSQNFPNPFSTSTSIPYALPNPEIVTIAVYNVLGEKVASLIHEEDKPAGYHAVIWDARNDAGQAVASGLYIVKLEAGDFISTRKTILVK